MTQKMTYVTQPHLPPLEEFLPYLEQIWKNKVLTNGGPFHQQLEQTLCKHLGVEHISLFTNGTIALVTALQSLRITGEVITTPYSFVATSHSLLWNGIKPVFVDIDSKTLNIDPVQIEAAITPHTTAILPVHCYGHPCDVDSIQRIADTYNLKVIYDAAHAFGVQCHCGSVLNHGDLSVLSFHATKVFNTFEGGAIICPDAKTKIRIDQLKNFGHVGELNVVAPGINGKMSEFNAALGLLQLKHIEDAIARRRIIDFAYRERLSGVKGIHCLGDSGEKVANYAYFPILVEDDYRTDRADSLFAKLFSRLAYGVLRLSMPQIPPGGFDFVLMDRKVMDEFNAIDVRHRFFQGDLLWTGYRTSFIPYVRLKRTIGKSQYNFGKKLKNFLDAVLDASYLPIRLISLIGLVTSGLGVLYSASIVISWFRGETPFEGWAPLMIVILMVGGLIMVMLGVIGEYVWRINEEVRKRPNYVVRDKYL